jgi:phage tail sheath protein FI
MERIVSPGVFTQENDQSFLAQGISELGAVIVGPTEKGPAFVPTIVNSYNDFIVKFGGNTSDTYVPNTVKNYLSNASSVTVTRVLGNGGWQFDNTRKLAAVVITGSGAHGQEILLTLHPSKHLSPNSLGLEGSTIGPTSPVITGSFLLTLTGSGFSTSKVVSASLLASSPNYITKTLGKNEGNSLTGSNYVASAYPYVLYKNLASEASVSASLLIMVTSSGTIAFTSSKNEGYDAAKSPWITNGNNTSPTNLFRFVNLSHGHKTNTDVYVSIAGLQEPADIDGVEQYSIFSVLVRRVGDTDKQPSIVEQYNNINLNPDSPNFIAKAIGDRYFEYDSTLGKVVTRGNYPNVSNYLRVELSDAFDAEAANSSLAVTTSPRGFIKLDQTVVGFSGYNLPPVTYTTTQSIDGAYNTRAYLGFDFTSPDNYNYLKPVPTLNGVTVAASQSNFTVNTLFGHANATWVGSLSASVDLTGVSGPLPTQVQFTVAMQGGTDGINPAQVRAMGTSITTTNAFGFDLSSVTTAGSVAFNKALAILSNQDEYDFNILVVPGVLKQLHSAVTNVATSTVEERGDAFYIMDLASLGTTVAAAVAQTSGLDSSYVGVYYPWVKVLDSSTGRPLFVPPSVVLPGVFAENDRVGAEWFAPAGFNRGGLGAVIEPKNRLSHIERDTLYSNRINPIAAFPGLGVAVYGQKTLQVKATALDRIGVRRLLINLKKFVASSSKFLVFEQNTLVTRNRFLNIVNPYLESVVQRQGLYGYRVVMDETNNTADVIDRNELKGAIYLQPTRTAEFIILDFNILPTGATFEA